MNITIDSQRLQERIKFFVKNISTNIEKELEVAGGKILDQAQQRFSSNFSGGKFSNVLSAIRNSGVKTARSQKGDVMLFIANMDILDRETILPPSKSTGNVFHFWRILHEGAGFLATAKNPKIFGPAGEKIEYPILAIVQTSALEPLFSPGRQAPVLELQILEGQGVIILKHQGFEGHAWFLENAKMFQGDLDLINKAVELGVAKTNKDSQRL